jgi:hypothetical protein
MANPHPPTKPDTKTQQADQQREQQRQTDATREAAQNQPTPLVPGRPAKAPDAPILSGHEGDDYATVTLIGGGPGDGRYRVAQPLPQAVSSNGGRYLRSTPDTYAWQVK